MQRRLLESRKRAWQALFAKTRFEGKVFGRGDVPSEIVGRVAILLPSPSSQMNREFGKFMRENTGVIVVTTALSNDAVLYALQDDNVLALVTTSGSLVAHGAIVASESLEVPDGKPKLFICGVAGIARRVVTGDSVRITIAGGTGTPAIVEKLGR